MTELLKFVCRAPGCGKKLSTQKRLEIHIKSKHPELFSLLSSPNSTDLNFSKNPIENIINSQKTKIKSNILQPIKKKAIVSSENNNIDSIVEKLNIKCNVNCLKNDIILENMKLNKKNEANKSISEITDDLIFSDENSIFEDYTEIINLDLSKKNIIYFDNNKNIPFEYFTGLIKLNLSNNNISKALDLKYFTNLKILFINNNKIKDISFCEYLLNLEILKASSNEIVSIDNLLKCNKLKILDISNNKIENIIMTLKAIKKLKTIEELNINPNPFIINLFAYKHYFIYKYQNLIKIDGEEINEIDKDISGRFIRENISMYENVKELNENNNDDTEKLDINNNDNNIIYKIGNTVISKEMYVPYKSKNKINNSQKENKIINENNMKENNDINIQDIKKENVKLKEIIEEQKNEIDNLKLELENNNLIIKDYESLISQYKLKFGDINNYEIEGNINIIKENNKINKDKKEIESLKKDLEMWKKEYFDLLYKKMDKDMDKDKKCVNNNIEMFNDEILKINKEKGFNSNSINKNIDFTKIERPKTAVSRYENPLSEFKEIYKEISIMKSRNVFADVLEEETDEEEENEGDIKYKKDNNNNMKDYLNKNKIKNENNKDEEKNNNSKILKPLLIKNKKVNDFNIKFQ